MKAPARRHASLLTAALAVLPVLVASGCGQNKPSALSSASASASSSTLVFDRARLPTMPPEDRQELMRQACRPSGSCAPGQITALLEVASAFVGEQRAQYRLCEEARQQFSSRMLDAGFGLLELEKRARTARYPQGPRRDEYLRNEWAKVDRIKADLAELAFDAPGVSLMRTAADLVRECFSWAREDASACEEARKLVEDSWQLLGESHRSYCNID